MKITVILSVLLLAAAPALWAQQFETSSIKPAIDAAGATPDSPDRFIASNETLAGLVRFAYDLQPSQVIGGETWVRSTRFDVEAKASVSGRFALSLSFSPGNSPSTDAGPAAPPSVFTAVREQLGLALNTAEAPVDVLVINSAHLPTAN
jgi:hypothetical protein